MVRINGDSVIRKFNIFKSTEVNKMFFVKKELSNNKIDRNTIILFCLLFLASLCFFYTDVNSTIRQGMNFWKALFEGDFFHYYSINILDQEKGLMQHNANYDMLLNFLVGIWQLPLYIIEKIIKCDNILDFFWARVYGKTYYLILLYISGIIMKKIGEEFNLTKIDQDSLFFMYCSNPIIILSICNVTQSDIIAIIFSLLAILFLFKDDKRWLIFFVLACQCKNFAFFLFVPIILLNEKKILRILFYAVLPWITQFLINLPFRLCDPIGVELKDERMLGVLADMTKNKVEVFGIDVPIVFIVYIFICILAYVKTEEDKYEKKKLYLYFGALAISSFFICFGVFFCYWAIYMVPFIILIFYIQKGYKNEKALILEMIGMIMYIAGCSLSYAWCFDYWPMRGMLIDIIIPFRKFELHGLSMLHSFLAREEMFSIWTITYAVFVAWLIYFFIDNRPSKKTEIVIDNEININKYLWIRALIGLVICNITIIFYAITIVRRAIEVIFLGG